MCPLATRAEAYNQKARPYAISAGWFRLAQSRLLHTWRMDREHSSEEASRLNELGYRPFKTGDTASVRDLHARALERAGEAHDPIAIAQSLAGLMRVALRNLGFERVRALVPEGVPVALPAQGFTRTISTGGSLISHAAVSSVVPKRNGRRVPPCTRCIVGGCSEITCLR